MYAGHTAVRPFDANGVHLLDCTKTEREDVVDARLKSARGLQLLVESLTRGLYRHLCANRKSVGSFALQLDLEVMVIRQSASVIAVNECGVVLVVHDQVERAIAIQIRVRCAV